MALDIAISAQRADGRDLVWLACCNSGKAWVLSAFPSERQKLTRDLRRRGALVGEYTTSSVSCSMGQTDAVKGPWGGHRCEEGKMMTANTKSRIHSLPIDVAGHCRAPGAQRCSDIGGCREIREDAEADDLIRGAGRCPF
jgi:hypothetical protein